MRLVPSNMLKPSSNILTDRSNAELLLWILFDGTIKERLAIRLSLRLQLSAIMAAGYQPLCTSSPTFLSHKDTG